MKGNMKYKYGQTPTNKQWANARTYNAYEIAFAVDISTGDDGREAQKVLDILEHERKETYKSHMHAYHGHDR